MVRAQLILALVLTFALAGTALAQDGSGTFDTDGSGNSNSGSGTVPAKPKAKPKPTATAAPAPARAPAPAATRAPVATAAPAAPKAVARPRSAPSHKPAAKQAKHRAAQPAASGCLSSREQTVLQQRAAGDSIAKTAATLDISRARVRALQRSGVARLLSNRPACADEKKERKLTTVAKKLKAHPESTPQAAPASNGAPLGADLDLAAKKASGPSGLVLLLVGLGLLLLVVGFELRKQLGLSAARPPRRFNWRD
jgi:DNA-binding CsgD family transcriptional regulator